MCTQIKAGNRNAIIAMLVQAGRSVAHDQAWRSVFGPDVLLIPLPTSAPTSGTWPARVVSEVLIEAGLASGLWTGLRRIHAVAKSASSARGSRPTLMTHLESFAACEPRPHNLQRIVLVDDVITRGRTLLAAAARVRDAFPHASVAGFAVMRTLGYVTRAPALIQPCLGVVRFVRGDAWRIP